MTRGNLTTDGEYEKTVANQRRGQNRTPPQPTPILPHHSRKPPHEQKNPKRPGKPVRTHSNRPSSRFSPISRNSNGKQKGESSKPSNHACSKESGVTHAPKLRICKPGDSNRGRSLVTVYDSGIRETLVDRFVAEEMGLQIVPCKPGNPVPIMNNKRQWIIEVTEFIKVHGEVPELGSDADLGTCNFGIMPPGIRCLEGVEIIVRSKIIEKLVEDCDLLLETRAMIDSNYQYQQSSSANQPPGMGGAVRQPQRLLPGVGQIHQSPYLRQRPFSASFLGTSNTPSVLPSGFSSHDAQPVSTPKTSVCGSVPTQLLPCDHTDTFPQPLDGKNTICWESDYNGQNLQVMIANLQTRHCGGVEQALLGQAQPQKLSPGLDSYKSLGVGLENTARATYEHLTPAASMMSPTTPRPLSFSYNCGQPIVSPNLRTIQCLSMPATQGYLQQALPPVNIGDWIGPQENLPENQTSLLRHAGPTAQGHSFFTPIPELRVEDELFNFGPSGSDPPYTNSGFDPMDDDPFDPSHS